MVVDAAHGHSVITVQARYVGPGDHHDERYAQTATTVPFFTGNQTADDWDTKECKYNFVLYASEDFERSYRSDLPIIITVSVMGHGILENQYCSSECQPSSHWQMIDC